MNTRTRTSLLVGLQQDGNSEAWESFSRQYRPVLIAVARQLGLSPQDAEDAVQDTFLTFAELYRNGQYQQGRGRLRSWLIGIAKNKIRHLRRKRIREFNTAEEEKTALLNAVPDDHTMGEIWESEWRRMLLEQCMQRVRVEVDPATMGAFELLTLNQWSTAQVAEHLQMTPNAVIKAKQRVLSRLRETYQDIEGQWGEGHE